MTVVVVPHLLRELVFFDGSLSETQREYVKVSMIAYILWCMILFVAFFSDSMK